MPINLEKRLRGSIRSARKESAANPVNRSIPSKSALQAAGHELKENPPAVLAKTRAKKGKKAAQKQRVAILLSKARRGK